MSTSAPKSSRPRCIYLAPRAPWPLDDGGRVVLLQDLLALAGRFETRAVIMRRPGEAVAEAPAAVSERGIAVTFVEHRPPAEPIALARGALGRWPYTLERFQSASFARGVRQIVEAWRPDLAYINNLHLAPYLSVLGDATRVLRQQNLEQLWLARFADATRNPAVAAYARFQAWRMRGAEATLCRAMALVLAMHEDEAAAIRAFAPGVRVESIPAAAPFVDLATRRKGAEPTLLVIGSFDREANAEGACRFLEKGWPVVRTAVPGARLRLVGRQMPDRLVALAHAGGAEPVGYVPDLTPELSAAWGMVIPLWYGAGMRVKTVEAIAAGLPVAATPLAAEGLGLEPERHYLEGRSEAELGAAALQLLTQPERAAEMAARAHAFLRPTHGSEEVARRTTELCAEALASPRGMAQ